MAARDQVSCRVQVIGWAYVTVGRTKDASLGSRNVTGARRGWGAPCNRPGALMRGRDKRESTEQRRGVFGAVWTLPIGKAIVPVQT